MSTAYKSWRRSRRHDPGDPTQPHTLIEPLKIFDNLAFIGDNFVACFLIETRDGLILLDNMVPGCAEYIEKCVITLGYDPAQIKAILISHGHGDHYGSADYFRSKYGTKLYMSEIDEKLALDPNQPCPMPFSMDGYLTDGGIFTLGDTGIQTHHTPGHTPGTMSFIFDVYDEGRHHRASLWGGTGTPCAMENRRIQLESCNRFAQIGLAQGCDVEISTHPFLDNSLERLELLRNIVDGVPNPFVLGYEGYHRFETMYHDIYVKSLET